MTVLSSENTIQQIRLEREGETKSTFFSVTGDRSGRQICRRQNAGEVWPGGGWPIAKRVSHDRELAREREREREGGSFERRRPNAGEATPGRGRSASE